MGCRSPYIPPAQPAAPCAEEDARHVRALVLENPRLATAVLVVLEIVAGADRRRKMRLIEAASRVVLASPRRTPERPEQARAEASK